VTQSQLSNTTQADAFDIEHEGFPARKFLTIAEAQDFMDDLWELDVSFRAMVVRPRRKPQHIMVLYLGPVEEMPMEMM